MALSERRVLHSIKIVGGTFAEFEWKDQILRGDDVISESNHNGAYPIKQDGTFDTDVETLAGLTIAELISPAADQAIASCVAMNADLQEERAKLTAANEMIFRLQSQLLGKTEELQQAANQVAELVSRIAELEAANAGAE